jgi:Ribbon-helix-helix protein, copG family.
MAARSVVSVRFGEDELEQIKLAADRAGMSISTYVRNASLVSTRTKDFAAVGHALSLIRTTQKLLNTASVALRDLV